MKRDFFSRQNVLTSIAAVALQFGAACSDEESSSGANAGRFSGAAFAYESKDELPPCAAATQGSLAYIIEEGQFYLCKDESWEEIDLRGEQGDPGEPATSINAKLREVWSENIRSVAFLRVTYGGGACTSPDRIVARGTGFIVAKDLIATNAHVAGSGLQGSSGGDYGCPTELVPVEQIEVWFPSDTSGDTNYHDRSSNARVTRLDDTLGESDDLSLLEVNTGSRKPLVISEHDQSPNKVDGPGVRLGEEVLLIGYSKGDPFAHFVPGQVNAIQPVTAEFLDGFLERGRIVYQVDTVAGSGSSGGPLLNLEGEVVGINFAGDSPSSDTTFSYSYRVKPLRDLLEQNRSWHSLPSQ